MELSDKTKFYLIGNAHLDPIWLWKLPEGLAEIKATFQSALDRMEEFPDYIFTAACASYYAWVEANEPAMFEKIKQRVAEGRWAIAGGMWIQPDCNIPCGEAFARQLLYAQRYFREKFGCYATVGYNVDSFGHNGMLPQLLSKAGITGYVFLRPNAETEKPELPENLFVWQSPDGSQLLAYRIPTGYSESGFIQQEKYRTLQEKYQVPYMMFYGVGNHGGGPTIRRLQELETMVGEEMYYASPDRYFAAAEKYRHRLPVVQDDLQHHASGCYSANAQIKKYNRRAESALLFAEKMDVLCTKLLPEAKPQQTALAEDWKKLLFYQFHDVLAGCCIRSAMDEACDAVGGVADRARMRAQHAMQKLSWNINTHRTQSGTPAQRERWCRFWEKEGEGAPVVVFNPHGFAVRRPVYLTTPKPTLSAVCDEAGNFQPFQNVRAEYMNQDVCHSSMFMAEVPAYGYRTYYVYNLLEENPAVQNPPQARDWVLENQFLRIEFDREHGYISQLTDKRTGRTVNAGPLARAVLVDDSGNDTWAHNVFTFAGQCGEFSQPQMRVLENGPLRAGIRIVSHYGTSTLCQDYYLYEDSQAVEVQCRLFFAEQSRILRLCFDVEAENPTVTYAMPFGCISKQTDGKENPAQCWADLHDAAKGLAVISNCKYSFSAVGNTLQMIVARSCGYADHYGVRDGLEEHQDLGEQKFSYYIYPHGSFAPSAIHRQAAVLQQDIQHIMETFHDGPLEPSFSGISGLPDNVLCETVKQAEDGNGTVLRLYETDGRQTKAQMHVLGHTVQLEFGPCEIKTLRLTQEGIYFQTDILEDEMPQKCNERSDLLG